MLDTIYNILKILFVYVTLNHGIHSMTEIIPWFLRLTTTSHKYKLIAIFIFIYFIAVTIHTGIAKSDWFGYLI